MVVLLVVGLPVVLVVVVAALVVVMLVDSLLVVVAAVQAVGVLRVGRAGGGRVDGWSRGGGEQRLPSQGAQDHLRVPLLQGA